MKIELIKKTYLDGYEQYYINKDGEFVSGTETDSLDKVTKMYDHIVKSGQTDNFTEVIKSVEL